MEASNNASRKYYEEIPKKDRIGLEVIEVMKAATRNKHASLNGQFSKFTAIANSKFGDAFLDEVSLLCFRTSQIPIKYC